ncbi:phospholipid-translocating P-type ATPase [Hyphopichia burtonii NRRL Y-1933]|uniref:Phospholipid-transporting ATPase n=1 Tax=Hyphopichia burtonii NRRL Y-1933 TaxID=984485 RepID=A0A1E4RQS4_9ASCO|nr:phospholipid-translocating P-type ATPase [Hyphopichia burtonii NRRL Y-1933]ODV69561.1 phospholipid-translocating P-type ATPase [Hyphopichia burtonii NRRL Y-1933]
MYYEKLDFPCVPKTWNISDDLGQIEYIFSDKTGTLTQNVMEFKKCTINGKSYGLAYTEAKQGLDKRNGVDVIKEQEVWKTRIDSNKSEMIDNLIQYSNNDQLRSDRLTFVSNAYVEDTLINKSDQKIHNEQFMFALALCHTVVTEQNDEDPELRDFKAESPDEAALVSVASDVGIVFKNRLRKSVILSVYGEDQEFELLEIIPFTSARKRMSCIFRFPDGTIKVITKGADNVIFQRLSCGTDDDLIHKTALHLEDYAKEGLRTLCIAERELDPKFFDDWHRRYKEAASSIEDDAEIMLEKLSEDVESDLLLLGGTAIEDRLQQGVPDSIALLAQAGIKLWVLTGDRIETAINIGFSCNLLGNDMKLLVVRPDDKDASNIQYIDELISKYLKESFQIEASSSRDIDGLIKAAVKDHSTPSSNAALIIDGAALSLVFNDSNDEHIQNLRKKFLILGKQCNSVLCCRVSPAQKAEVVKIVKNSLKVMTLAIGDGANDVAMIQAANVGVGIAGEEGRQAVMSSDYAIGQFRFLTRLLLVHGRWSYKRLAEMVPCFFYKNVVFTLTCFWYGIYNDFDGSYLYEYTYLMFYNLAFTSLPVIVLAVLDQDVSDTISLVVPQLYRSGVLGLEWSQYKFVWYMLDGLYQSVISFFFPYLLFYMSFQNPQGLAVDHRFWIGVVAACISVTACDIYVLLQQYRWDWLSLLIDALSILVVYFWSGVWSSRIYAGEFYKAGAQVLGTLGCWCCIFIGVIVNLLPRFTYDFLMRNFKPRDIDIIRERARRGEYIDYPEGYDPTNLEDIERHRILTRLNQGDTELLEKIENNIESDTLAGRESTHENSEEHEANNPFAKTFKSIRRSTISRSRRGTVSRSRRSTVNDQSKHHQQLLSKPLNLHELRLQMIKDGEYNTGSRNSLERISTTHELPGLTQAETLISYHKRNSINFDG